MKFNHIMLAAGLGALSLTSCKTQQAAQPTAAAQPAVQPKKSLLNKEIDSVSYSIGVNIAMNIKSQGLDSINTEALVKGMEHIFASDSLLLSKEQTSQILSTYFQTLQSKKLEANSQAGKKFLEENKTKPGVVTTQSGLQYQILKEGTGPKPKATDKVQAHYKGSLLDGTVFDSSYDRGQPLAIGVSDVIPGWTEALQLMPVGSKWKLFIPSELAYGERGAGQDIGPNSTLVFEVEVLSIDPPAAAQPEKKATQPSKGPSKTPSKKK